VVHVVALLTKLISKLKPIGIGTRYALLVSYAVAWSPLGRR
jgi:hypothetical protein